MRRLPVVTSIIAAPCDVPWASMQGDHRSRHCAQCNRDVHNLSAMTETELFAFLDAVEALPANQHKPCVSLFQRFDGTVLTADCPIGMSRRQRRALLTAALGAAGVAVVAVSAFAMLNVLRGPQPDDDLWASYPKERARTPVEVAPKRIEYPVTPDHRRDRIEMVAGRMPMPHSR
ncbi:MAG: hypothetical protein U0270_06515 [Labilithrix sp.]